MSALYGSAKGYVHSLSEKLFHGHRYLQLVNFITQGVRAVLVFYVSCIKRCYFAYSGLKMLINKLLQPVRVRGLLFSCLVKRHMSVVTGYVCRHVWFTRLNRNISVIRKRIKKVSNDCYLVIVQQLNRIPEPAWVAVVGKIYNEHEGIARIRNISKKKIISGEKAHARTIIWSMVFVIVTYSMFHKALEFAYKSDIENELGIFFDRKINIDSLEFGFFPGVKLLARGVSSSNFEGKPDARIQSIYLGVNFSELLWGDLNINYLHLDHATVDQDFLLGLPATFNKPQSKTDESSSLNINTFTAGPVKVVTDSNKSLGDYRVTVVMTPEKNLKLVKVMPASSSNMTLVITPYNEIFRFDLQASNWKIPGEYSIVLKSADVKGTLNNAKLVTSEMKGELYGGSFNGNLSLMWSDKINLNSSIRLDNVDSGKLLQSAGQKIITGKMDYKGILNINDMGSGDTWPNTYIKADFRFKNGVIHKADLEKASSLVNKNGTRGGQTRFDEFKGKIFSESGNMQLKNIEISSSALAAQGYLKVNRNNKLDGEVDVGLNNTKGILSIPLKISGVIDEPTLRPTNEAMAGAAIGTAILPGIGTALGVKVGKAVSWFKNVIKEDKDKQVK